MLRFSSTRLHIRALCAFTFPARCGKMAEIKNKTIWGDQMDWKQELAHLAQDKDEAMLLTRVCDRLFTAILRETPAASCFLSPREQALAQQLLRGQPVVFFGGTEESERKLCCYLPEYLDEDWLRSEDGPIAAVRAQFHASEHPSHRDFLGALMGCGVKRETVGDIYVAEDSCDFLLTREILPYLLQNLTAAGRTHLRLAPLALPDVRVPEAKTKTIRDTVSSLRLDSVVASGFGLSRAKAAAAIESGKTELNHLPCLKPDRLVCAGDWISVRGLGKLRLTDVLGTTKKGRTGITISRFA